MKKIAFSLLLQILILSYENTALAFAEEQVDMSNEMAHSLLERMFGYNGTYEDFYQQQSFDNTTTLKKLPIIKHDMSEEIRQTIISSAKERMKKERSNDYENTLACEYVFHFCDYCCSTSTDSECVFIQNNGETEKIYSYPANSKWELTGALLTIAQSDIGKDLLLSFMTFYKKNPSTPKIVFFLGKSGGVFSGRNYGGLYFGIIVPLHGPLEPVYNTASGNVGYVYSSRSAVTFHELVHLIHKVEDSAMLVRRYVSLDVAAQLFAFEDASGRRIVRRRLKGQPFLTGNALYIKREYEDEDWKTIKVDFCRNNALLKELKAEFTNDEEFYTIFGFFKDKDGQIKRDLFCESTFTSELYGYVRCGHWGPSNPNDMFSFNIMVNYGIPGLYIDPEEDTRACAAVLNQEIEEEKKWTAEREASAPSGITRRDTSSWWKRLKDMLH